MAKVYGAQIYCRICSAQPFPPIRRFARVLILCAAPPANGLANYIARLGRNASLAPAVSRHSRP